MKDPFRDEPDGLGSDNSGWSNHLCGFRQEKKDLLLFFEDFLRFGFCLCFKCIL